MTNFECVIKNVVVSEVVVVIVVRTYLGEPNTAPR